jgi:hypothetical protein
MNKTLGGFICVRNGTDLDYCWELAAESLLKVVDELVLCDSDSTDGTTQAMQRMADKDARIRVINWPWPSPKGQSHHWFIDWLNFARQQLKSDYCIYLDADEVLSDTPECHAVLREAMEQDKCLTVDRLNFWKDAQHLIPDGQCCGKWCTRFGRTEYTCVSDEPRHAGEREIVDRAVKEPRVQIFHMGFLREKKAFYRKARVVLEGWFNRFDTRLEEGEKSNKPVWETECSFADSLVPFSGYIPDAVQKWLSERGHVTQNYLTRLPREAEPVITLVEQEQPQAAPLRVLHSGDFGDLITALAVLKQTQRQVALFLVDRPITKPLIRRMQAINPLLLSQPYIISVKTYEGEAIDWNASDFRMSYRRTNNLVSAHHRHYLGQKHLPPVQVDQTQPWLTAEKADTCGRVVINRTARYHNPSFPWKRVVETYGSLLLFVGTADEHTAFEQAFGTVEYRPTSDMLEVARLIAGCELFIGNQSCAFAIAEGLKHPRILEVSLDRPDCIYPASPICQYVANGAVTLPAVGACLGVFISAPEKANQVMHTMVTPPKGWQYPGVRADHHINAVVHAVVMAQKIPRSEALERVYAHNRARVPEFFAPMTQDSKLQKVNEAFAAVS